MSTQVFPTKGNLISTKKSLALATMGYDLMDRKRNILIREMMTLVDTAKQIRGEIETTYGKAYRALHAGQRHLGPLQQHCGLHPRGNRGGNRLPQRHGCGDPPR